MTKISGRQPDIGSMHTPIPPTTQLNYVYLKWLDLLNKNKHGNVKKFKDAMHVLTAFWEASEEFLEDIN